MFADLDLPEGTVTLLVGLAKLELAQHAILHAPSFAICAIELALVAEAERVEQDTQDADNANQTITTATGSDTATRPLLARDTTYTVSARSTGKAGASATRIRRPPAARRRASPSRPT